jgi:gas vesicle protein|tara:strand:+ start:93 stop:263 length:171 start_codon:yes stop_codon:yes gene_type:complete
VSSLDDNIRRVEAEIKAKILDYDEEVEGKINKVNDNIEELHKAIETDVKGEAEKTK